LFCFILAVLALSLPTQPVQAGIASNKSGFPATIPNTQRVGFGIPTLADINGDGKLEILVGTEDGQLLVVDATGKLLWRYNVSNAINAAANTRPGLKQSNTPVPIRSAPAVGDINRDGQVEIVVAAGDISSKNTHGGVMALTRTGQPIPGWPFISQDIAPDIRRRDGFADGVVGSPAIGDINGDGQNEVVFGSFDHYIYALRSDASYAPGWPQFAYDSVWSSPALADLTGDGQNEVIIGIDAHEHAEPGYTSQDGGELQVFSGNGARLWRSAQDEVLISSPAVADLDGDGRFEIAAGSGNFYCCFDGTPSNEGKYFTVWNHDGSILWRANLPTQVVGSPAIGDLNGDGKLEVVVGAMDGKVYAFDGATGQIRWSTQVRDMFNNQFIPKPVVYSPMLADYTGNGHDDVFIALGWDIIVVRGSDGVQLTATSNLDPNKPSYYTNYTIDGAPAIGDLDGNGKLDLVAASANNSGNNSNPPLQPINAQIHVWELPNSSGKASWPQFSRTADNRGLLVPRLLTASTAAIGGMLEPAQSRTFAIQVKTTDGSSATWTVEESDPSSVISLNRTTGGVNNDLLVTVGGGNAAGRFTGRLTIRSAGMPDVTVNVDLTVRNNLQQVYIPLLR
jgi:outer membrane protein assembly factor BamB